MGPLKVRVGLAASDGDDQSMLRSRRKHTYQKPWIQSRKISKAPWYKESTRHTGDHFFLFSLKFKK